jgi:hypothetical protein
VLIPVPIELPLPSMDFSELLFTEPGLFMLPSALPPPAAVCATAAPEIASVSAAARVSVFIGMDVPPYGSTRSGSGLNVGVVDIVQAADTKPPLKIDGPTSASLRMT